MATLLTIICYDFCRVVGYYTQAKELAPANAKEYTEEILTNMYYGRRSNTFTFDEVEAEAKRLDVIERSVSNITAAHFA